MKRYILTLGLACAGLTFSGCEDFLKEEPVHLITTEVAITNAENAQLALNGVYHTLQDAQLFGQELILSTGLLSDEIRHSGTFPTYQEFDNNDVQTENVSMSNMWNDMYYTIHAANQVIDRVPTIEEISAEESARIVGEAKFIRALVYFHIVNLWGGAPLALTPDINENSTLTRSTVEQTYAQIISDLTDAEAGVRETFESADESHTRATKGAVRALLAEVYLHTGQYDLAEQKATQVIDAAQYSLNENYADIFSGNSTESIFEIFFSSLDNNSLAFWNAPAPGGRYEYAPTVDLVNSYEEGDERLEYNIAPHPEGWFYINKYRDLATGADRPIILRLGQTYLTRAEARANQNNLAGALSDLNVIRNRAGLDDLEAFSSSAAAIAAIEDERFVEMAFEGDRWAYLVGTEKVNEVMSLHNPATWRSTDARLPIPRRQIELNENLVQNEGY